MSSLFFFGSGAEAEPAAAAEPARRADSDSEPDWLRAFTPKAPAAALPDSSDDDDLPIRRAPAAPASARTPATATLPAAAAPAAARAERAAPAEPAAPPAKPGSTAKKPNAAAAKRAANAATAGLSHLPLLLADRLARSKVLVELEGEGDAVDLDGDVGCVGRLYLASSEEARDSRLRLDLKGVVYQARVVPSTSCLLVRVEGGAARVEAVFNDYVATRREVVEVEDDGLHDGFAFGDSEASAGSGRGKAKRKREEEDSLGGVGGGSSDEAEDVGKPAGPKAKKKPRKKAPAKTAKGGAKKPAKPRAKPAKPRAKPAAGAKAASKK